MKKTILLYSLVLSGLTFGLVGCNNDSNETIPQEIFKVSDVTVEQNKTAEIQFQVSNIELTKNVEYYFEGSNIRIDNNIVTGLVDNTVTEVTAFSGELSDTFTVTVLPNFGTLTISDLSLYVNGPGVSANPKFSNPKYEEDVIYTFDSDAITYKEGLFYANKSGAVIDVTAKTSNLETTFKIRTYEFTDYKDAVNTRVNSWKEAGSPTGETIFIGDSFFDTQFWENFYVTFAKYQARTFGISATTSTDWEFWLNDLVFPQQPKNIVMHVGTNNIFDDNKTAEQTIEEVTRLIETIHKKLPDTKIYYFGIEPRTYGENGSSLEDTISLLKEVNTGIKAYIDDSENITYLDSPALCYNQDGTVNSNFFRDGTHPKLENYSYYVDLLNKAGIEMDIDENAKVIDDFSLTVANTVSDSKQIIYDGETLSRNYVFEGELELTKYDINSHIEFRFGSNNTPSNRFLLWDNDSNGSFGLGWAHEGNHAGPADPYYSLTNGKLDLTFRIVVTDEDAYFYVNDQLLAVYYKLTSTCDSLYVGAEKCEIKFSNMKAWTLKSDKDEYEAKIEELNIKQYENAGGAPSEGTYIVNSDRIGSELNGIYRADSLDSSNWLYDTSNEKFNIALGSEGNALYSGVTNNAVMYNGETLFEGDWKVSYDVQLLNSKYDKVTSANDTNFECTTGNYFFFYGVSVLENSSDMWKYLEIYWRKDANSAKIGSQMTDEALSKTGYEDLSISETNFHVELERTGGSVKYTTIIGDITAIATLTIDENIPLSIWLGGVNLNAEISNFSFTLNNAQ